MTYRVFLYNILSQQIAKNRVAIFGHFLLIAPIAMVFKGQNDRVFRGHKGRISNSLDTIFEIHIGTHSFAVGNNDLAFVLAFAVPAV